MSARNVARALVPAASRLVSTLGRGCDTVPDADVGMSADAAGTSARATARDRGVAALVAVCALFAALLPRSTRLKLSFEQAERRVGTGECVKYLDYTID